MMNFWAQPAPCAGLESFDAEFDLPTAGRYGASFELHPLRKKSSTSKTRSLATTAPQSSATSDSPSNRVSKHSGSSLSFSGELTDGLVIQSCPVKPRSTVVPQSPLTVPESPTKAAAAGSAADSPTREDLVTLAARPVLPNAADPIDGTSGSLPHSGRKRGREAGDVGEYGRPPKRVRVPDVQNDRKPHDV